MPVVRTRGGQEPATGRLKQGTAMTDKPEHKNWGWVIVPCTVAAIFALYVLSMGPAYAIAAPFQLRAECDHVYAPVWRLAYRPGGFWGKVIDDNNNFWRHTMPFWRAVHDSISK